jgi:DNA-binding SARP family transcriptional activator
VLGCRLTRRGRNLNVFNHDQFSGEIMIDVRMFGPLRLHDEQGNSLQVDFCGNKPRLVFLLLAEKLGSTVSKDRLADQLWQGNPPPSWRSTLEGYVSLVRKGLTTAGDSGFAAGAIIVSERGGYRLDADRVATDLDRFTRLAAAARSSDSTRALALLTEALELSQAEVMAGERNLPWITEARDRYQQDVHRAAVRAGQLSLTVGDLAAAAFYGKLACDLDPLAEDGWHISIESDWRANRRSDALRSFSALRNLLDQELGIVPCRSLQQLLTQVLRDEPLALTA